MMVLAWTRSVSGVYPVLWYTALPAKGEGDPGTLQRILQSHVLTDEQEKELDALPDGVSRIDRAEQFYPLRPESVAEDEPNTAVDIGRVADILAPAIDAAVWKYRTRMRAFDGQSAQIDRENGINV